MVGEGAVACGRRVSVALLPGCLFEAAVCSLPDPVRQKNLDGAKREHTDAAAG